MKEIILLISFQLLVIPNIMGCGCGREEFSQKAYDSYELIFIGRLIEEDVYEKEGYQALKFEVIEILKGQTTKIITGRNTAFTCSLPFEKGQEWIIYSNPEYGMINDQFLCGLSTLLKDENGESVVGKEYYPSEQKWMNELKFLRKRKSNGNKIVSFQLVRFVPLFQATLLIMAFASSIFVSEKIKFYSPSILPASIVAASLGAIFLYFILLPEQGDFKLSLVIITLTIFLVVGNLIYKKWLRGKLNFTKSFVLCYITYLIMMGIAIPLTVTGMIPSNYHELTLYDFTITDILRFLSFGLPFSGILAFFYSDIFKRLVTKCKTYLQTK